MVESVVKTRPPIRRVVLLGASNLTLGLATAVDTTRTLWNGPLDILAAAGHGRSYGMTSRVLARTLPSILSCGLWSDLSQRPPLPTAAVVTDVGNDLLYEAPVTQITAWVAECLSRLAAHCEQIVVTQLPLEGLLSLPAWRFYLLRTALFPRCRLSLKTALEQARELQDGVVASAVKYGARLVTPRHEWYGLDPIHIRRRCRAAAWRDILGACQDDVKTEQATTSFWRWLQLVRQRPQSRHWLGKHQQQAQPVCTWPDNTAISLY